MGLASLSLFFPMRMVIAPASRVATPTTNAAQQAGIKTESAVTAAARIKRNPAKTTDAPIVTNRESFNAFDTLRDISEPTSRDISDAAS